MTSRTQCQWGAYFFSGLSNLWLLLCLSSAIQKGHQTKTHHCHCFHFQHYRLTKAAELSILGITRQPVVSSSLNIHSHKIKASTALVCFKEVVPGKKKVGSKKMLSGWSLSKMTWGRWQIFHPSPLSSPWSVVGCPSRSSSCATWSTLAPSRPTARETSCPQVGRRP